MTLPRRLVRTKPLWLLAILIGGAALHVGTLDRQYPIEHWLLWRYAGYWALCLFWNASCLAAGHTLLRALRLSMPAGEHLVTAFATGVLLFAQAMFVAGLLHAYHPALFVALPAALLAVGGRSLYRYLARLLPRVRRLAWDRGAPWRTLVVLFGVAGVALVYVPILTPHNIQYDAYWKHLALAEDYAAYGGIHRFPEGWISAAQPQMAAQVFQWAFLLPTSNTFHRLELAAHMEMSVFLWTVASIPSLVRLLLPRSRAWGTWTVRFLFPGLFVYDSTVSLGSDHLAALFAIPIFTAFFRTTRSRDPAHGALLAMMLAGVSLVKFTAAILLVPFVALATPTWLLWPRGRPRADRRRSLRALVTIVSTGLLFTTPLWLKNWVWYGDPVYPNLHHVFAAHPWSDLAAERFEWGFKDAQLWRPSRDLDGVLRTLRAVGNFALVPHDWGQHFGKVPVFGSLMSLLLLCAPLLKLRWRFWVTAVAVHLGVLVWYWTHHQDRYLQAAAPVMAALTAVLLVRLWQEALPAKVGLAILVGAQVVTCLDAPFIPAHFVKPQPLERSLELVALSYQKRYEDRFAVGSIVTHHEQLAEDLPPNAHVLFHEFYERLGIERTSLTDHPAEQYLLSYGRLGTPEAARAELGRLGVTHVVWRKEKSMGWDTLQGDLVFFSLALALEPNADDVRGIYVAPLPQGPLGETRARPDARVTVGTCEPGTYESGIYRLSDLTVPFFGPRKADFPEPAEPLDLWDRWPREALDADFLVIDPDCYPKRTRLQILGKFRLLAKRPEPAIGGNRTTRELYVSRRPPR